MEKPNFNGHTTTTTNNNTTTRPTTFDGTQATRHGYNLRSSSSLQFTSSRVEQTRCILRASALVLTFVAAIVMGTGKDTARVILITDPATMKMSSFVETTQAKYSSALVYFIVINVLMFLYSASSLAVSFLIKDAPRQIVLGSTVSDLLFLILLFSSNGAAITTNITIEHGNKHMGWIKICDAVSSFCAHVTAAVVLSMFASVAHLVVVLLEVISVHNRV